jgi:hypothetical protein
VMCLCRFILHISLSCCAPTGHCAGSPGFGAAFLRQSIRFPCSATISVRAVHFWADSSVENL